MNSAISPEDDQAIRFFRTCQALYALLVRQNMMFHQDFISRLRPLLAGRLTHHPCDFLDLGCGDASMALQLAKGHKIGAYTGVDLCEGMLSSAQDNLNVEECTVSLQCMDLLQGLQRYDDRADIILASFSVHHLSEQDKQRFLILGRQRLVDNGCLVLVDHFLKPGQDLQGFIHDVMVHYSGFEGFTREMADLVHEHVSTSDFPVTIEQYRIWGKATGWKTTVVHDCGNWAALLLEPVEEALAE
ncbi:class I SAM-dependent methyltransferase [Kistimonas asteriae]|uniref:class I SAM-dependent methyltransferase n=1 Tax=Kistimonas asteriae TaxID=517724 RepID=UPI001BA6A609|nr:class I SAM-dependent methyltransferase [Kistimonas asteriae]